MEESKTLGTEKDLIIDELCEHADELDNIDDLAWYCVTGAGGRFFIGSYAK